MWDKPFEESMLKSGQDVIIFCPNEEDVHELFDILRRNGVKWTDEDSLKSTRWRENGRETCYRVQGHDLRMRFAYRRFYEREWQASNIKCQFYGGCENDVDEISDDNFNEMIFAGSRK